jgi:two-component system LytT family response regulator
MNIQVVIVDNDPGLLTKLKGIFENESGVTLLASFEEAVAVVDYVKEHPVDMVFTDIVMPDISGITLAKELNKLADPPAVVLLSSIPGFSLEAWKVQAYTFVEKPYTAAQIRGVIRRFREESDACAV